ncbi:MAG: efflux RND transporter permease subunit, partial [Prochlorotrichaceae cyanobacterium]
MFVNFFIKRPVFTSVCALATLLIGLICIPTLPIAQYPDISPKQVTVNANFIGADAATVENSVTNVLERAINGVEGMRYMTSSSSNDGSSAITVTFAAERDENVAAVDVQNRISVVEPQLPESVVQSGVSVSKQSNNILLGLGFYSEDDRYDSTFLSNYADLYIVDALKQVPGVASIRIFGERKYAMRIWLNPDRLASRQLTADDVIAALREQNLQASAGRIGQAPVSDEQGYEIDLRGDSRLTSVEDFEEVVISRGENGNLVQLKDVGRVELGSENYNTFVRFRGKEAVGLGIFQLPSSNALEVAQGVKAKMKELAANFPQGIAYDVGFDTTDYVEQSMKEVVNTLLMAVGLVIVVILIFLQDGWSTVIPAITIPVSLIGTFAFVKLFGFSINSLTLFGLTLASGMVVDDAIVVVEDISRRIKEGLDAKSAAIASMRSLTGAVIATSLVLMAVFVPVAFFPGTTGALYRQFALTIAFSIAVST